jgi:hypothetical protein
LDVRILIDELYEYFQTAQAALATAQAALATAQDAIGNQLVGFLGDLFLNLGQQGPHDLNNGNEQGSKGTHSQMKRERGH